MKAERQLSTTISQDQFLGMMAKDIISMAAKEEGLGAWSQLHGDRTNNPSKTARQYAHALYGDSDEATLLNTMMTLEIDRRS